MYDAAPSVAPAPDLDNCIRTLSEGRKPFPRTCLVCGLGPCKRDYPAAAPAASAAPTHAATNVAAAQHDGVIADDVAALIAEIDGHYRPESPPGRLVAIVRKLHAAGEMDAGPNAEDARLLKVLHGKWNSERDGYWPAVDAMDEAGRRIQQLLNVQQAFNRSLARLEALDRTAAERGELLERWYERVPTADRFTVSVVDGMLLQDPDGPWILRSVVDAALAPAAQDGASG